MNKSTLLFISIFIFASFSNAFEFSLQDSIVTLSPVKTDSLVVDSLAADSLTAVSKDTLRPVAQRTLFDNEQLVNKLTRKEVRKIDYRYTEDLFMHIPFGYLADLGSVGNPSEVYLYGMGFSNISYMQDGVPINNRYQNGLDLNLMQVESIDSIVVPGLASGFFYNSFNNPVSVNFNTRLRVDPRPYSRLHFYQGPNNEGMVDGLFSAYPIKRLNVSFQITNHSADSRYTNSELSNWIFNTRVRYMLNNNINFIAGYDFKKIDMELNGGVDAAAAPTLVFDNIQAEVKYEERYHQNTRHHYFIKSLIRFDSLSYTDLSIYSQDQVDKFRQNKNEPDTSDQRIVNDNKFNTIGISLNQKFMSGKHFLQFIGRYESTEYSVGYLSNFKLKNYWSIGSKAGSSFLDGLVNPSVFLKYSDFDVETLFGFGANVSIKLSQYFSAAAGFSNYERLYFPLLNKGDVEVLDFSVSGEFSFADFTISFFNIKQTNFLFHAVDQQSAAESNASISDYFLTDFKRSGINLKADIDIWRFRLSTNSSYYFNESELADPSIPAITSYGGIYFIDKLYNNNLDLKTGVNYKFYTERNYAVYDFQKLQKAYHYLDGSLLVGLNGNTETQLGYQFDFFLAGTIQKRATIYFVFENFLDYQYYVIPYYPIQPAGLRLGFTWEFLD